jgi:hypothetical protein
MAYYIRPVPGAPFQIWKIDDGVAARLGITNPEGGPGPYFKADPGESVWHTMKAAGFRLV